MYIYLYIYRYIYTFTHMLTHTPTHSHTVYNIYTYTITQVTFAHAQSYICIF